MLLTGAAVRSQIASIVDVHYKAAVAEISKVVDDSMVVLRLEMSQRENEIKTLKNNIEILHNELRTAHGTEERPPLHFRSVENHHAREGMPTFNCPGIHVGYVYHIHTECVKGYDTSYTCNNRQVI